MITVTCILKSGSTIGYDSTWVEKLQRAVARNLTQKHNFVCLTDMEVSCQSIPLIRNDPGVWSKLELFRPGLFDGPVLYIDLDNIVCGNLDELILKIQDQSFVMLHESDTLTVSSSIMWWQGDYSHLWTQYCSKASEHWQKKYRKPKFADQGFIEDHATYTLLQTHIPQKWIAWFSRHRIDKSAKILVFRKATSKPSTAQYQVEFIQQHWI